MARLQIRDVKEQLDKLTQSCSQANSELAQTNSQLAQKLDQVKVAVYILATIQLGLVAHLIFSVLSR